MLCRKLGHYAESPYAECHYAECHYAECHYAKCHYAECRYDECRSAKINAYIIYCSSLAKPKPPQKPMFY